MVKKRALLVVALMGLVLLLSVCLPRGSFVSAAPHVKYDGFSAPEGFSVAGTLVSVVDDAVYAMGYYSVDGAAWQPFALEGASYGSSDGWLIGSGSASLPAFSGGEHYVIAYSCSWDEGWDCHGGEWQLLTVNACVGLECGLVASWDFGAGAGGVLIDDALIVDDEEKGDVLSPNTGGLLVLDNDSLDLIGPLSLSAWVMLDSSSGYGKVVVKPVAGGVDPWEAYALDVADGDARFILSDGDSYASGGWHAVVSPMGAGAWHHVVGTYDGEVMRLYLDGSLVDTETVSLRIAETDEDLFIGCFISGSVLDGFIDDVLVYDRALSQDEVVILYEEQAPISSHPPLVPDADYYVSVAGDDANPGSRDSPFRTIQRAVDVARAGDHVFVMAGEYHERVTFSHSGAEGQPIIVEGQRGVGGERLVTVVGADSLDDVNWVLAPEMSAWTYKTTDIPHESFAMMVEVDGVLYDVPQLDNEQDYERVLAIPPDGLFTTQYNEFEILYWDGIDAVQTYDEASGTTYLRFRDGDDPNQKELFSAPGHQYHWRSEQTGTFMLRDVSHVTIRGFVIESAQHGVFLYGSDCFHNIIEDNEIVNGKRKVRIAGGAHSNHVRDNELHMRFLGDYRPGAWTGAYRVFSSADASDEAYAYAVSESIYNRYKHEIGRGTSSPEDDGGVYVQGAGSDNKIYGNRIYNTLGGVGGNGGRLFVYDNEFYNISSIGTVVDDGEVDELYIYGNRFENVNIAFRVQLNTPPVENYAKKAWFYNNRAWNPPLIGSNLYFSRTPERDDPLDVSGYPLVCIYHNSFSGGGVDQIYVYNIGSEVLLVNNVFSDMEVYTYGDVGVVDYNWFSRGWGHVESGSTSHNVDGGGEVLWTRVPEEEFVIPDSAAGDALLEAGIDVSGPFVIDGRSFLALPGMEPGYFDGVAPDLGALQR